MDHTTFLLRAVEVSKQSVIDGNHPFGAILVDADGDILLEQGNIEVIGPVPEVAEAVLQPHQKYWDQQS